MKIRNGLPFTCKIIAVDFDGTLFDSCFPDVGTPRLEVINWAIAAQQSGHVVILWTCREGEALQAAVQACAEHGLHFDAVNELPVEYWERGADRPYRKLFADIYVDDRALTPEDALRCIP